MFFIVRLHIRIGYGKRRYSTIRILLVAFVVYERILMTAAKYQRYSLILNMPALAIDAV